MSLTNEERKTLIALHIKKAHETFDEIGVLTMRTSGVVLPIVCIMQFFMQ